MGRKERLKLIQSIESKRDSKLIVYVTSDRANLQAQIASDVISRIHEHLLQLSQSEQEKVDFFIYSRGGAGDVPWALVSMFREYCKKGSFSVLVPFRAHSAATVIALGADEIIMTKKGELGPIDATLPSGPYNPVDEPTKNRLPLSVEDVTGYFSLLRRFGCERPDETMEGFRELTRQVHPLALGSVNRTLEETKLVGLRLLATRAKPFSEEENHEIIRKLSSELYSHSHSITRTEARDFLGLKHVVDAEKHDLANDMWNLFCEYRDVFSLDDPFMPEEHLISNDIDEQTWENLPIACIESVHGFDICRKSIRVKRLRQIPPNLNVNLNNISFPPVTLQGNNDALNQQQIAELVQNTVKANLQATLNAAVQNAVNETMKSLPQRGFEHVNMNSGWSKEN